MIDVKQTGAMLTAVAGTIGWVYAQFTPKDQYLHHVADSQSGFVLDTVERARQTPPGEFKDSLCRTLQQSIGEICEAAPDHAICMDRQLYLERAGCL